MAVFRVVLCLTSLALAPAWGQTPPGSQNVGTYTLQRAGAAGANGAPGNRACGLVGPIGAPLQIGLYRYEDGTTNLTLVNPTWQMAANSGGSVALEVADAFLSIAMQRAGPTQLVARVGWAGQPRVEAAVLDVFTDRMQANRISVTFPNAPPVTLNGFSNLADDALLSCTAQWLPTATAPVLDPFAPASPAAGAQATGVDLARMARLTAQMTGAWLAGRMDFGDAPGPMSECSAIGPEPAATASHLEVTTGNRIDLSLIDRVGQFRGAVAAGDPAVVQVGLVVGIVPFSLTASRNRATQRLEISIPAGQRDAFMRAYLAGAGPREMLAEVYGAGRFRFALPDPAAQAPLQACIRTLPPG